MVLIVGSEFTFYFGAELKNFKPISEVDTVNCVAEREGVNRTMPTSNGKLDEELFPETEVVKSSDNTSSEATEASSLPSDTKGN